VGSRAARDRGWRRPWRRIGPRHCPHRVSARGAVKIWAQVWDIPPIVMAKAHYLLPRRRCGCGRTTTAAPPFGTPGNVVYGLNVNAAAILLASEGNVPLERTAMLMASLLGTPVSTGFVARALERFAQRLAAGGFDEAMKMALRAQDVLCADETPTNVVHKDTDAHGEPVAGSPHAVTVRTPDARLVWYVPICSRSKTSLADLGVLEGCTGAGGSAKNLPGCNRDGTRKSRAPSGLELVRIGVWNSLNPRAVSS
jgi:hypothetical protein